MILFFTKINLNYSHPGNSLNTLNTLKINISESQRASTPNIDEGGQSNKIVTISSDMSMDYKKELVKKTCIKVALPDIYYKEKKVFND